MKSSLACMMVFLKGDFFPCSEVADSLGRGADRHIRSHSMNVPGAVPANKGLNKNLRRMDTGFLVYHEILGILLLLSIWFLISKMGIIALSHRLFIGLSASLWIHLALSFSLPLTHSGDL